jgi:hypothetical protein
MKKLYILFLLFITTIFANATIWRVNNNSSMGANFASINDAVNSASVNNSDTLHIEPSGTNYPAFTLTKRLVLIGVGYYLQQSPGFQATAQWSRIGGFSYLEAGSTGSVIQGLDFSVGSGLSVSVPNVVITRCCFTSVGVNLNTGANNFLFWSNWGGSLNLGSASNLQGVSIRNSFLWSFSTSSTNTILMENCYSPTYSTSTGVYKNNIFHNAGSTNITSSSTAIFSHNIFYGNPFTSGGVQGSNLVNIANAQIFSSSFDSGNQQSLIPINNSVSNGAGENGVNIGIFGGATPYKMSGIPAIPSIYLLNAPGATSGSLPVTIGIRSND